MRLFCRGLCLAAGLALLPQVVSAQQAPGSGRGRFVSPIVAALDTNKDGDISAEELAGAVEALKKLDKNSDGKLSADELRPAGFGGGPGGPGGRGPGGPGGPGGGRTAFDPAEMIKRMDKNSDGKLAKDEVSERMQGRFGDLDKNGDGFLDADEIKAMTAGFGGRPGGGARPGGARPEGARPDAEK